MMYSQVPHVCVMLESNQIEIARDMDSMAEEGLLRFLKLKLTEEQANKFSVAERQFLIDKAFDDIDALKGATLAQLEEPPGDRIGSKVIKAVSGSSMMSNPMSNTSGGRGGLRVGMANMLLAAFGPGANTMSSLVEHYLSWDIKVYHSVQSPGIGTNRYQTLNTIDGMPYFPFVCPFTISTLPAFAWLGLVCMSFWLLAAMLHGVPHP